MKGRLGRRALSVSAVALVTAAITVVPLERRLRGEVASRERRLAKVEERLVSLARERALVGEFEASRDELERRIEVITALNGVGCTSVPVLRSVLSAMGTAGLRRFHYEQSNLVARILAPDLPAVIGAAERLARVERLDRVEIREYSPAEPGVVRAAVTARCIELDEPTTLEGGLR